MKKKFTFLIAAVMLLTMMVLPGKAVGQSKDAAGFTLTTMPDGGDGTSGSITGSASETWNWTATFSDGATGSTQNSSWQVGSSKKPCTQIVFTTSSISGTISNISVSCGTKNAAGKASCTVGGVAFGNQNQSTGTGNAPNSYGTTPSFTGSASGAIEITITNGGQTYISIKSISVTYSMGETQTVTFDGNGGEYNSETTYTQTVPKSTATTLMANQFTYEGYFFLGWSTVKDGTVVYSNQGSINTDTDITLYAKWRQVTNYTLVTKESDIVSGAHYIIANEKTAGSYSIMDSQNASFYRNPHAVTIKSKEVDDKTVVYIEEFDGIYDFVLSGDNDNYFTFYDNKQASAKYLAATGSTNNNYLSLVESVEDKSKWSISIDETTYEATIVAQIGGDNARNHMRYNTNSGQYRFACYKSSNSFPKVYLYKKDNDTDLEIYSPTLIASGKTVECDTYTIGNANASLTIADGGQLVHSNTGVQATIKKHIDAADWANANSGWNFIASPMTSLTINNTDHTNLISGTAKYDLYTFDQSEDDVWQNYKQSHFTTLNNGTGYLYAREEGVDIQFIGELANPASGVFDLEFDKNVTGNKQGVNLVGNPYPCNATVSGSCYVINGNIVESVTGSVTIAPCTGVIVKASDEGQTVTFTKAPNTPAMSHANNNAIELTLTQAGANTNTRGESSSKTLDNAIVSFNEGSKLGKFYFGTQNANIYIPMDNEEYAIVSTEARGEMPVNFKAAQDGQYTITVNPENVEMGYLHLIDNITGTDIDLLANPSYTFNAKSDDYESRFRLVFSANNENQNENEKDFAFFSNGQLIVTGEGTLQVVDMMGRVISTEVVNGTSSKAINAKAGVYVLRLMNGENVKTQKIVVR